MNRGDVVRVQLPRPKGAPGSEQFGTRPAIVVQSNSHRANSSTIVIVPLTSRLQALRFPGTFKVFPSPANGLDVESVVLTAQIRAIDRRRIEEKLGEFSADDLERLDREMRGILSL